MAQDPIARLNDALEGRYRIERELGEGGMATVYLADDLKHERKVALKVLKPELAAVVGAERFLAEIKTTANLQHPHILPLFDSGEAGKFLFYVMPYIDGETLRDRLDREKQLPVDEALGIATAVANALQTAHEAGVIHRDIKPGNILLSRGEPLVADFGIALAVGKAGGNRLTETGLSVGTPFYMSPEQATGDQVIGPASDTYALACVLYEMLVGDPPYPGSTAQAVLGKIIQGVPVSATAARPAVPPNVDAAIRKALEKLPADRFRMPRDFARALADPSFRHGVDASAVAASRGGRWRPWALASSATTVALAGVVVAMLARPAPPVAVTRVAVAFDGDQQVSGRGTFDVSPDGSLLVYQGPAEEGSTQLWVRRWDALDGAPIRDTQGGVSPAISPDGGEVAFLQGGGIRVVPIQGGISRMVAPDSVRCCPRWSPDGEWLFFNNRAQGLSRVPSRGGPIEVVTQVDTMAGDALNLWVDVLPGGQAAVFEATPGGSTGGAGARVAAVRIGSGDPVEVTAGRFPRYSGGYLFFTDPSATTLLAAPFDPDRLELTGPARPIAEGLRPPTSGWNYYAVSQTGSLVYTTAPGASATGDTELVWVSREGAVTPVGWSFVRGDVNVSWRLSPSGSSVALRAATDGNLDVWVKELPDRPPRRLTFTEGAEMAPWWTPDGRSVSYISPERDVWVVPADGTGAPELLLDDESGLRQGDWSPDGTSLVLRTAAEVTGPADQPDRDLLLFRPGVDERSSPLVATAEFAENNPAISSDGRFLAYASTESGRYEVWVRTFPDVQAFKYQVSAGGGTQPRWAHNGRELFYLSDDRRLMVARFEADPTFRVVGVEPLLTLPPDIFFSLGADVYDVGPDDQRFIMARDLASADANAIHHVLVLNALEELGTR